MSTADTARVMSIAIRTAKNGPMRELVEAEAEPGRGLTGDLRVSRSRGLTLLAQEQWQEVLQDLGAELPWHTRRANLLIAGLRLVDTIGKQLQIGEVLLEVLGETEPCGLMDRQHFGLRAALTPECRAGVHGSVIQGGTIRVGDAVRLVPAQLCAAD